MGVGGDKYVCGGIFLRRARGWNVNGQQFENYEMQESKSPLGMEVTADIAELNGKLAALEVRNYSLMRNKIRGLVVPLACIVDYFGQRF